MSSGFSACALALALVVARPFQGRVAGVRGPERPALRVCSDPNNLPFSNARGEGFENEIAQLIARDLNRPISYYWLPQRRGFVRNTLAAGNCDLIPAVPVAFGRARTTRPYYRSTYVWLTRHDRGLKIQSLDDPALKSLRIGIQITGQDYNNPPAAQALARRQLSGNVRGFTVYGDYSNPEPQRAIVDAVADGQVDVAIVWGPLAGFYAKRESRPLDVAPLKPSDDGPGLPFVFDIGMGVRSDDGALYEAIDHALRRRRAAIHGILARFGVPEVS